jgi:hypothetical protein
MRIPLACAISILLAGCAITPPSPGFLAAGGGSVRVVDIPATGAHGLDAASAVIHTPAEFDAFLERATTQLGANDPAGFVHRLKVGKPDFERQVLVLVRHDECSGSSFRFSSSVDHSKKLICDVLTQRLGTNRDMVPYWFAVAVDTGAVDRVEVRVDGRLQQELRPRGR